MGIKTNVGKILIMPKGAWVNNVTYYNLDMVTHNGSKYLCKVETCIGIEPSAMTIDTWYPWDDNDIGGSPVAFTTAVSRSDLGSGEPLSILMGKIKKWLADLKTVAFTGNFMDLAGVPTASETTKGLVKVDGVSITADEDGTLHGSAQIDIDDEMSATSENPVQNKVLNGVIGSLDSLETFSKTSIVAAINEANHELLTSREELEAVTETGKGVDATVVSQINSELEKLTTRSTEERAIGYDTDGKIIYERTFNVTTSDISTSGSRSQFLVDTGVTVDHIVSTSGCIIYHSSGNAFQCEIGSTIMDTTGAVYLCARAFRYISGHLGFNMMYNNTSIAIVDCTFNVTVRYTKN